MPKVVTSTELQKNSDIIIDWAKSERETVIVETSGQPLVAILPFDEYQEYLEYKKMQHARTDRFKRLRQLAEQNATYGLSEAEASALVEAAREEVYQNNQDKSAES
ncbi:MAG: type II toxin-antitoxin system Phd/YefM family antitoxin [Anaerolineae bacterium]|nr:type II toxin-antitoxin system Phd/YefM family antitoxin [Anaerolineae bacterium]